MSLAGVGSKIWTVGEFDDTPDSPMSGYASITYGGTLMLGVILATVL